jgi:2-alkyl-3-oxoalkanoate reductase
MRVLVTGARGMLGGAVARALAARGDTVSVLQRNPSGLPFREVRADLGDPADAAAVATAVCGCDAVVHLAAKVDVVGPWREYARVNVEGTRALLAAAHCAGVGRFVHVSSPSVAHAGSALVGAPAAPADPDRARGHYARSKALAEQVALDRTALDPAAQRAGPAVVAVRPHLVWGPGDRQLVGRIVARARAGRLPVVGTGAALIDTTYVDDAVDALVAALDRAPMIAGRALVVSGGEPRPVAELLAAICAAAGADPPRVAVPAQLARAIGGVIETLWARRGDPPMTRFLAEQLATAHWFDQRATRAALGWKPRVGLDEGFRRLRAAFRSG